MNRRIAILKPFLLLCLVVILSGCAEGPLWRTGYLSPWTRQKWDEEQQIAATVLTRKNELAARVEQAQKGSKSDRDLVADQLNEVVESSPILLLRMEAVKLLGQLATDRATSGIKAASVDSEPDVRKAAIQAWKLRGDELALTQLQTIVASDTNLDVRLAATRALGSSRSEQAIKALAVVLDDPNPAVQYRATRSLAQSTGENFGEDVAAWKQFVATRTKMDESISQSESAPTHFDVRQTSSSESDKQFQPGG